MVQYCLGKHGSLKAHGRLYIGILSKSHATHARTIVATFLSLCIRLLMQRLNSVGLFASIVSALPSFSPHNTWIYVCACVNDCVCSLGFKRSPPPPLFPQMSHQLCTGPEATHTNSDERDTDVINILFGVFTHISSPSLKLWRRTIRTQKEPQS